jgi:hypothetical protein
VYVRTALTPLAAMSARSRHAVAGDG